MNRKVSIIIPVLNRAAELRRCLGSVARQDWRPLEVVVVDNGSDDGSPGVAREWGRIFMERGIECRIFSHADRGASRARNRGLAEASGEMVVFLDSDDSMRPGLIEKAMKAAGGRENVIVCWRCAQHLERGDVRVSPVSGRKPLEDHLVHTIVHPLGCMAPAELWLSAGGWNENLSEWDDLEAGTRMLLENPETVVIPEILGDVWWRPDSITGSGFSSRAGKWETVLDEISREIEASAIPERGKLLRLTIYRKVILAAKYWREGQRDLAETSLAEALRSRNLTAFNRLLLGFAYHYTRLGGRGAWRIVGPFM